MKNNNQLFPHGHEKMGKTCEDLIKNENSLLLIENPWHVIHLVYKALIQDKMSIKSLWASNEQDKVLVPRNPD